MEGGDGWRQIMADGGFWWRAVVGWGGKWWVEGGGQWAASGGRWATGGARTTKARVATPTLESILDNVRQQGCLSQEKVWMIT